MAFNYNQPPNNIPDLLLWLTQGLQALQRMVSGIVSGGSGSHTVLPGSFSAVGNSVTVTFTTTILAGYTAAMACVKSGGLTNITYCLMNITVSGTILSIDILSSDGVGGNVPINSTIVIEYLLLS